MHVPFVDLKAQYARIQPELDAALQRCLAEAWFVGGPPVAEFEAAFSDYLGGAAVISVGNGTDALEIALEALGLPHTGGEVLVPAMSWFSTAAAVSRLGGEVVFVDVLPGSCLMDPEDAARKITDRTVGLLPVHLYGQVADLQALRALADAHHLWLLEDAAQAAGATYQGQPLGTLSDAATFSFYPGKNLGAYGDGGAIVTRKEGLAKACRQIANYGGEQKHEHHFPGRNSRLDTLQAAILSAKLPHLDTWVAERTTLANRYYVGLQGSSVALPPPVPDHAWHIYVVQVNARDAVQDQLTQAGITTNLHYPVALPFLPAYAALGHTPEDFPVASHATGRILSLPLYPELSHAQQDYVMAQLRQAVAG